MLAVREEGVPVNFCSCVDCVHQCQAMPCRAARAVQSARDECAAQCELSPIVMRDRGVGGME
eukprot:1990133-Pyramimonas_sp.AAC.1